MLHEGAPALSEPWERRLGALPVVALGDGLRLHEAVAFNARRKGLAGVDALPADVALHIRRCWSVHTFGMRFPLDLVWLDRRGAVVRVDAGVRPRRARTCVRARTVVETAAGSGARFAAALSSGALTDLRSAPSS